jgi:hypothetical protein
MKKIVFVCFIVLLLFCNIDFADARQGCCSHHGGVCGCSCCDGTSLSATCAPYYPECNRPIVIPKATPIPTVVNQTIPEPVKESENYFNDNETSESNDFNQLVWFISIIAIVCILFIMKKNKK